VDEPRLGGRAPAILGVAGFVAAVVIFAVVLFVNPFGRSANAPAPSAGPSQLPKSARLAQQGDCLQNQGTSAQPVLIVVTCGSGTYEVLERLEGTTQVSGCDAVQSSTYHYFYDSELPDSFDFVLCMSKRP
jgi:hypothetical protein